MTQTRKWSMMTVGAVVGLLAIAWFLLLSPAREATALMQSDKVLQDSTNEQTRASIQQLKKQAEEVEVYRAKLQKLEKRIPQTAELPKIIRSLQGAVTKVGVAWTQFDPEPPKPVAVGGQPTDPSAIPMESTDGLYQVLINMQAEGSYTDMEKLLREIEDLPRAFLVTSVTFSSAKMNPAKPSEPLLELKLAGQVYTKSGQIVADAPAPETKKSTAGSGTATRTDNLG